ncbi:phospholipase A2 group III [Scophthalmus maximus]|uniref:phospholipase A2 n=1 Tax=Scophthalmus maximus TaxID=52904 RepID=A0A2U9B439_SCOMX|nr:phospholipase A2 group III [Scophthalmus maximus]
MWSVLFVFLSHLDRTFVRGDFPERALDAEEQSQEMFSRPDGTFCAKMSSAGENFLYRVSDGAEVVSSVVSSSGELVTCSVVANQTQARSFVHECRSGPRGRRGGRRLQARFARMSEAKPICREFKSKSGRGGSANRDDSDDSSLQNKVLKRSKRGFTYPGTLWCGAGNMADHYDQLGEFAETDSCCRIHDHCPHVIHAFSSNYGHTNFKWHSICHCDCDKALKACLRKVNDTSSRVVGQAFFNVIGVPCFELTYEEQCAERHWYGLCKLYEKRPIAVLREAVPYDFGGIDVIDELTLAPPSSKDSKTSAEEEKPESTTQSTMSGPGEPSLTNVVTAAEDFIKVLATVSTSQSSATDSDKGEAQSSEKKKRKNTGKKKKTTKKQKGKGRKRKQKAEAGVKTEEGAAVSPSGSKAGEVVALTNFINESHKQDLSSTTRVRNHKYELGGKGEPSNEVMKDEPAVDKQTVSITPSMIVQKKPAGSVTDTEEITLSASASTTAVPLKAKHRGLRKGRRKKSKKVPPPSSEDPVTNTADHSSGISVPSIITISPLAHPEQQSFGADPEKRPVGGTASASIGIPKVKRNRSKERGDSEGRKKRRKVSSAPPIVATAHENSSVSNLKVIHHRGAPTVTPVSTTEPQVPHWLNIYGGQTSSHITVPNSSLGVVQRQRSKGRGARRRKTALPLPSENPLYHNTSDNMLPILTTPDTKGALNGNAATAAITRSTHSAWGLSATAAPAVSPKRHRQTIRRQRKSRQRKSRQKAAPAAIGDGAPVPEQTENTPTTFTPTPSKVATAEELSPQRSEKPMTTSATPAMSPIQLSVEKAKAQFTRKKRRKAAQSVRQQ